MRKAFNFYNSYYATFEDLTDTQIGQLMRELTQVQFMDKHIGAVFFKDKMVSLVWKSIKHSILEQIKGHCSKRSIDYESVFPTPTQGVGVVATDPTRQEEVKVKVKVKVKEQYVEGLNEKAFKEWCKYKGSTYTARSKKMAQNKLILHSEDIQLEMVEASIMNGWKGLFPPKQKNTYSQKSATIGSLEWERQQMLKQQREVTDAELI